MGIQIKGSNDTISADDGSIVLEGATLTFTNENITGISTMASAEVTGNLSIADKIIHTGDTNTALRFPSADTITAETSGSEWIRIDSGGRLLVGNTASQEVYGTNKLQIQGTSATTSGMSLLRHGGSPYLILGSSGGSSLNAVTALSSGDRIGQLTFVGADGTDVNTHAASIAAYVDGSVSSNSVPGRLVFKTSTGASEVERMRITSSGLVGINTSAPTALLSFGVQRSVQTYPPICFQTAYGSGLADAAISTTDDSGGTDIMMGSNVYMGQNGTFTRYFSSYGSAAVRCGYTGITMFYNKSGNNAPAESMRIDGSGRLLIGTAANQHNGGDLLQLAAESSTASLSLNRYTANAHPSYVNFFKSRNASLSGQTVVQDGDTLGLLAFYGSDGTDRALGAEVCAQVDGTPGSDDMPGRLVFRTSADGSQSPAERLRITSGGNVNIGGNYDQSNAPLSVTTTANAYGYRLMTGSNVVMELLNNDAAGNCEMRGYYNNNSGSRGEGYRIEAQGETFFNPGGNTGVSITANGKLCAGGTTIETAPINVNTTAHYVVTSSGRSTNGIHIRGNAGNSGEYGGAISFGCNSDGAAAIAAEQMSSDADVIGLSFFTRSTSTGADDATKTVRFPSNGGVELHNWANSKGLIFRSDSTVPTGAMVQSSVGRGMCSGKVDSIAQNTATTLGNSHWGGLALVGYEGTGHQGYRLVAYGYGGAGVSVLFSGQWVGSLTTTFTMNTYSLQVSHNSSNNLNFWLINLGV